MFSLLRGFNNLDFSNDKDLESSIIIPNSYAFRHLLRDDFEDRNAEGLSSGSFNPDRQDVAPNNSFSDAHKFIQLDRFNLHFVRQSGGIFESELFSTIKNNNKDAADLDEVFVRIVQKSVTFTLDTAEKWVPEGRCTSFSLTFDWIIKTQVQSVKISPIEYLIVPILGSVPVSTSPTYGKDSEDNHFCEMTNLCIPSTVDGLFLYSRVNFECNKPQELR
jgi:hypothetical protein